MEPMLGFEGASLLSAGGKSKPVMTQWVRPPWPELLCAKERTNAILSATWAILGKTPPSSMPGTLVFTAPTVLRYSAGADILGSNVSTCVGPPPSQSQMTEVFLVGLPSAAALARARNRSGRKKAPIPKAPTLRKSRRVVPSQVILRREFHRFSMHRSFRLGPRALPRKAGVREVNGRQQVASAP